MINTEKSGKHQGYVFIYTLLNIHAGSGTQCVCVCVCVDNIGKKIFVIERRRREVTEL